MVNESKFEYYQDAGKNNEWRWRFKAGNSEIIAMSSEGYTNEDDCKHSIEIIKKESPYAQIYKV